MKAVRYSVLQKGQILVASILLGCPYTSSINHRLVPDQVAAREWGMERFPDQSQINLFLNRMTAENVAQLEHAHQELLHSHSLLRSAAQVIVDIDQTGLRVTGKKFELAQKGYFPRRRGARGYQLSAALASAPGCEPEAISYLDPGNVIGPIRLPELLRATLAIFEQQRVRLVIRLDAGYGNSHATVDALLDAKVGFVLKWRDSRVAKKDRPRAPAPVAASYPGRPSG